MRLAALLALAALPAAGAVLGVDVSQPASPAAAACLRAAGYSFAIPRAWESVGRFDASAPGSVASFWGAKFDHVDVYMFPCSGRNATQQVRELRGNLTAASVRFGMLWLDIEYNPDAACAWAADKAANCAFLGELAAAAAAAGFNTGVYTSVHEYGLFFDMTCTVASHLPLWYPHYEVPPQPNFNDFSPFAGWAKPAIKQFDDHGPSCGVGVDVSFYP